MIVTEDVMRTFRPTLAPAQRRSIFLNLKKQLSGKRCQTRFSKYNFFVLSIRENSGKNCTIETIPMHCECIAKVIEEKKFLCKILIRDNAMGSRDYFFRNYVE
ncbi:hypothetical protein EAJ17_11400 [Akkermansia sp. aa_0143]|nr:hypothetical protein EAJ17_11400 [Akkermansia sp. aa_0143]